jgi:hypothetical protein
LNAQIRYCSYIGHKRKGKYPSHPRNKNMAEVFFKAGYIEAWGRGISMMMGACRKAGLPKPTIEELAGGMQITFLPCLRQALLLRHIRLLSGRGLLKNIGTKGSSAVYKLGVGS